MYQPLGKQEIHRKLALITQSLDAPLYRLRLAGDLEAQFEAETGAGRCRVLVLQGIAAIILYNSMLVLDYFVLTDMLWLAFVVRIGLVGGTIAVAMWITARNPSPVVRETLLALSTVVSSLGILVLVLFSSSPLRENYHFGIMFLMLFVLAVQHLRFWYAVPTILAMLVIHAATVLNIDTLNAYDTIAAMALTQAMGAFALYADLIFERQERRSWLHSLRDRLRAMLFEELSEIDAMTGLGNRRALDRAVTTLRNEEKATRGVAIAIVDIDHFKLYNDTFGHVAGDECLRRVAGLLTSEARKRDDMVFRFGGEEFVVLLPLTDAEIALRVCERMRRAVERAAIPHAKPQRNGKVTVSIGVAVAPPGEEFDPEALIFQADSELYEAKNNGRNQVRPSPFKLVSKRQRIVQGL